MAANNHDATTHAHPTQVANMSAPRRVLGDMSPNVKLASPAVGMLKNGKPMTSSPLKRSFTAAIEDGAGLKYQKRRRLSGDETLSRQVAQENGSHARASQSVFGGSWGASVDEGSGRDSRPIEPLETDVTVGLP